jgi:hypothetical protein
MKGGASPLTPDEWFTVFWELLDEITQITQVLRHSLTRCAFYGKSKLVVSLRNCIILANTAFVELHLLMIELHAESRRAALAAVDEIIDIMLAVTYADYLYLDPMLVVCFPFHAAISVMLRREEADAVVIQHCWMSNADALTEIERHRTPDDNVRGESFAARQAHLAEFQRTLLWRFNFLDCISLLKCCNRVQKSDHLAFGQTDGQRLLESVTICYPANDFFNLPFLSVSFSSRYHKWSLAASE